MLRPCRGEAEVLAAACERGTLATQHSGQGTFKMGRGEAPGPAPAPASSSPHVLLGTGVHMCNSHKVMSKERVHQ